MAEFSSIQVGPNCVVLRPAKESDLEFLFTVYGSTRSEELAPVPWTDQQKRVFLRQQFEAQDHAYRNNYPGAAFLIITVNGEDAGRLYLHPRSREIRIMDIALLPKYRNQGAGSAILGMIIEQGKESARSVTIHVEVFNPARHLYERLGFKAAATGEVHVLMEYTVGSEGSASK